MDTSTLLDAVRATPLPTLILMLAAAFVLVLFAAYGFLYAFAPTPRPALPSEKEYVTTTAAGGVATRPLPCWHDRWLAERHASETRAPDDDDDNTKPGGFLPDTGAIEPAQLRLSVVIPAYNEAKRIRPALEDAVRYLDAAFGRSADAPAPLASPTFARRRPSPAPAPAGYEIIVVDDGSTDGTRDVILDFAREHALHDVLRLVTLARNRGKGGAVTHGLRHVRGAFALFADADGASKFSDLGKLLEGCDDVSDAGGRGVAIGSRGHLVGSEAVVQRSALRNFLMRGFHFVLMILTPPATSRVRDTQCGFKLFSRAALPHIVPYMHAEGWIFDIEMLMLAESAPAVPVLAGDGTVIGSVPGIKVAEVPIDWHEVDGSKLNVIQDSVRMAVGLAVLRASWMLGVYRRRLT